MHRAPIKRARTTEDMNNAIADREAKIVANIETVAGKPVAGKQIKPKKDDDASSSGLDSDEDSVGIY